MTKNRIIGEGLESPDQLLANPQNFRNHPGRQRRALAGALNEIGWIQRVIVNQRTGHLIDGHLRVELAMERGEQVPVLYVDLTHDEERIALATIDPISALAEQDDYVLAELINSIAESAVLTDQDLAAFLGSMNDGALDEQALFPDPLDTPTQPKFVCCPSCGETFDANSDKNGTPTNRDGGF